MRAFRWVGAASICGALALACSVETEGAPCPTAGQTAGCPDGQACGNDGLCSERAFACKDTRCDVDTVACRSGDGARCTSADPVCGSWVVMTGLDCTSAGLECQGADTLRCDCPAPAGVFEVDGTNVNPTVPPFGAVTPTGSSSNGACRFATLGVALAAAEAYAANPAHGTATVRAMVDPEGGFGPAAGDALPIVVPPAVRLESKDATSPAGSLIATDATVASAMVRLGAGAAIAGFTLRNQLAVPDPTSAGCGVESDAGGTISNVAIETNNLASGVRITGSAPASLVDVRADAPRRAAVWIDTAAGVQTEIVGGTYKAARGTDTAGGHGIWIRGGAVSIRSQDTVTFSAITGSFSGGAPVDVSASTGSGVRIDKGTSSAPVALAVDRARIESNGAAGIHAPNVANDTSLSISASLVEDNNATNATTYFNPSRAGGGVIVATSASGLTISVRGSRVWRNTGDQIGLAVPDVVGAYDVSGGVACGDASNVIGSCSLAADEVFSTTDTAWVPAQHNYWQSVPPPVTNAEYQPVCSWVSPPCP